MAITGADLEFIDGGSFGFSLRSGRTVDTFRVFPSSLDDLQSAVTLLLGTTETEVGTGKLTRTPPMGHPVWPFHYCSNIQTAHGVGVPTMVDANPDLDVPTLPQAPLFSEYRFTCEFTPRPYLLLTDNEIELVGGQTWYDGTDTAQTFTYATEWRRYCWYEVEGKEEAITAQQGQLVFRRNDDNPPDGVTFPGMPKIFLPNQLVKVHWYGVPYRYVTSDNSYLSRFVGNVNQNDWWDFKKGTMLYLGYQGVAYTPPIQTLDQDFPGIYSTEKLCDLTLLFSKTTRVGIFAPTPSNRNWIAAGHNLQPWLGGIASGTVDGRGFYYVTVADPDSGPDATKQLPTFYSFPAELLWTDPDA